MTAIIVRRYRQSIYQDDEVEKLKGVYSLIKYATLCSYMLVPTEETKLSGVAATYPEDIPGYGARGWHVAWITRVMLLMRPILGSIFHHVLAD